MDDLILIATYSYSDHHSLVFNVCNGCHIVNHRTINLVFTGYNFTNFDDCWFILGRHHNLCNECMTKYDIYYDSTFIVDLPIHTWLTVTVYGETNVRNWYNRVQISLPNPASIMVAHIPNRKL